MLRQKVPSKKQQGNFLLYLIGAIIVVVIIVLVITKGGQKPIIPISTPTPDAQVQQLKTLSTSDEISEIEKDVNNTNLDQIDSELKDIEQSTLNL